MKNLLSSMKYTVCVNDEGAKEEIPIHDTIPIFYRYSNGSSKLLLAHFCILIPQTGRVYVEGGSHAGRLCLWKLGKNIIPEYLDIDGDFRLGSDSKKIKTIYLYKDDMKLAGHSLDSLLKNENVFPKKNNHTSKLTTHSDL